MFKKINEFEWDSIKFGLQQVLSGIPAHENLRPVGYKQYSDGLLAIHVGGDGEWRGLSSHPEVVAYFKEVAAEMGCLNMTVRKGAIVPFVNVVVV